MPNLFHKYQQPIFIILTIGVIASFILFWNGSMISHGVLGGGEKIGSIYGRPISDTDFIREAHKFQIASALGLDTLVQPLAGNAQNRDEALQNFIFNSYVFDHEATALQIFPTDAEVQDELAKVSGLQTDGRFDPAKLEDFVQNKLPSLGFTDAVIDELVRKEVQLKKVADLIGATVDLSGAELHNRFMEENQKMNVTVFRLSTSDLEKSIPVTDADAQKAYDAQKDAYRSEEQRKVSVASFELTDAQKALKGRDRTDALQKLGDLAYPFSVAVVDKTANFADQAQKSGVPVKTSAFFTATQPDPALADVPELAATAFKLSTDYPSSDVIEEPNGYYVLHLEGSVPSRQLTFDEAKPQVIAEIQKERAAQLMQTKANAVRGALLAELKAGKSAQDAAKAAGVTAETLPAFALTNASTVDVPDVQSIVPAAVSLSDGQLSDFISTDAGGLLVYMNSREPIDSMTVDMGQVMARPQIAQQKKVAAFLEWLRLRREAARLQIVQRGA